MITRRKIELGKDIKKVLDPIEASIMSGKTAVRRLANF